MNPFLGHLVQGTHTSGYDLFDEILRVTPDRLSMFTSIEECEIVKGLLGAKSEMLGWLDEPAVYAFEHGAFRGFQLGDPSRDNTVTLEVFDEADEQLTFTFTQQLGEGGHQLTQDDLNEVILTLKRVPLADEP